MLSGNSVASTPPHLAGEDVPTFFITTSSTGVKGSQGESGTWRMTSYPVAGLNAIRYGLSRTSSY